ncbi:caspase-7-like [Ylistrum balloti]|uniref:caspase-7-like n=1 Tax=Ylistrum balloti TaxID=509963 RepID=UPI002905E5BA|nr:caspase-7-like [Ylistrum balloti]
MSEIFETCSSELFCVGKPKDRMDRYSDDFYISEVSIDSPHCDQGAAADTKHDDLETAADTKTGDLKTDYCDLETDYCDLETDSYNYLEKCTEFTGDLKTDRGDQYNPGDGSFDRISGLVLDNSSISGQSHDQIVTSCQGDKMKSNSEVSDLNHLETDGNEFAAHNEETSVKMVGVSHDQWPQENGCAFRVKAMDMDGRPQRTNMTVKKIAKTTEDFSSFEYRHDHLSRGHCLIISNSEFRAKQDRPRRSGSLRDAKTLRNQFQKLGFCPIKTSDGSEEMIHQNLSREQLLQILSDATNPMLNDHSDHDCFVCVILSYGLEGTVVCPGEIDDVFVEFYSILEFFKPQHCPSLAMKPKLFFVHGCTPYEIHETQATVPSSARDGSDGCVMTASLPSMADCLVQFCGVDGIFGWGRNRKRGLSYYVQALCESLKKFCILKLEKGHKSKEISSLVLSINKAFVRILEDDDNTIDEEFGVPSTFSTLTKQMFFYPKTSQNDLETDTG